MKTYDDLSKDEKEKMKAYFQYIDPIKTRILMLLAVSYIGIFIGFPLMVIPYIHIMIAGFVILIIAATLVVLSIFEIEKSKKKAKLIFNISDATTEVFEIKDSDLKRVIRTWKVMK